MSINQRNFSSVRRIWFMMCQAMIMKEESIMTKFTDNTAKKRFELVLDGGTAIADYQREDGNLSINRVYVPEELRGQGAAGQIMAEIVKAAAKTGEKIIPVCSYAVAWMEKHGKNPPKKNTHAPR